jgi:hypothetical protein
MRSNLPLATAFHDPWLTSTGPALRTLALSIADRVEDYLGRSERSTRRDIQARRRIIVDNVVANLATFLQSPLHEPAGEIAIATGQSLELPRRYRRLDWPQRPLASVLAALESCRVLAITPYVFKEKRTGIIPTVEFWEALDRSGGGVGEVGRAPGGETIFLSARTGEKPWGDEPMPKTLVDYRDTEETRRLRREMEAINSFLNGAEIAFAGQRQPPVHLRRIFLLRSPSDRQAFHLNGRLVGAWWQSLKRSQRRLITVGRECVADLDFASAFLRLAYLRAGAAVPGGDLYAVDGLEAHREGVKTACLSLLSRAGPMRRLSPELKGLLPEGWTAARITEAIAKRHPAIAPMFGTDAGVEMMRQESDIMVRLTLALAERSIPALGLHDGVLAPAGSVSVVMEEMHRASHAVLGQALPVAEKPMMLAA